MGSMTHAIKQATGATEDEQDEKERLEILRKSAEGKVEAFRVEIDDNFLNPGQIETKEVPGHRSVRYIEQYHIASSENFSEQVSGHLDRAIDSFFSIGGGDNKAAIQGGVKSLISVALDGFIGSTSVGETEEKVYVVVPENNAFIRADIACWKYTFTQKKLISQRDTAVAYVLCKSVIDHAKLTVDELIYFATQALSSATSVADPAGIEAADESAVKTLTDDISEKTWDDAASAVAGLTGADAALWHKYNFTVVRTGDDTPVSIERLPTLDVHNPYTSSPPGISQVEAYIDELVRVWTKIRDQTHAEG